MSDYAFDTIPALLARGEADAPAVGAPDRPPLAYAGLRDLAERTVTALNGMGIGRGDRVAIVLPNGPEMATAFVTIACGAATAPLNPGYRTQEFDFYLADLGAKALIVLQGAESEARAAAAARGVPIIELAPAADGAAGLFTLRPERPMQGAAARPGMAAPEDVALVLHTSGTTSRPKIVPLRQVNITASAQHIDRAVALGPQDVCLNIMPLFHIHGLMAAVLASLAAGGSVVCSPGFNAFRFFAWFAAVRPTWYTAVPTMHQAILGLAEPQSRRHRGGPVAADPLVLRLAAAAGDDRARGDVRRAGDRELRHDRGRPSDGLQPAAAAPAVSRLGRRRRRSGDRDHG